MTRNHIISLIGIVFFGTTGNAEAIDDRGVARQAIAETVAKQAAAESFVKQTAAETSAPLRYVSGNGLFDLALGQVIDLTDRKVLMTLPIVNYDIDRIVSNKEIMFMINGHRVDTRQGMRIDLKDLRPSSNTFKDMAECYLDVLDVVAPKGGKPFATFRFNCH